MKKVMAALIGATLACAAAPAVHADPTPAPTSTLSPQEQFKVDMAKYQQQMKDISQTFALAVDKAKRDYQSASSSTKSPDVRYQAKIAYKAAVQSAADSYDAAIAALGPAPTPPAKPFKSMRTPMMQPNKKSKN